MLSSGVFSDVFVNPCGSLSMHLNSDEIPNGVNLTHLGSYQSETEKRGKIPFGILFQRADSSCNPESLKIYNGKWGITEKLRACRASTSVWKNQWRTWRFMLLSIFRIFLGVNQVNRCGLANNLKLFWWLGGDDMHAVSNCIIFLRFLEFTLWWLWRMSKFVNCLRSGIGVWIEVLNEFSKGSGRRPNSP